MKIKIISFYTPNYAREAARLEASLNQFNLDYTLDQASFGSWHEAVSHKPKFIMDFMNACLMGGQYTGILWTDADSEVMRQPDLEELGGCDAAWHRFQRSPKHGEEFLTGTIYFAVNSLSRAFVRKWAEVTAAQKHNDTPEQLALQEVYGMHRNYPLVTRSLGPEWCYIFDDSKAIYPDVKPVFQHYQASRRLKYGNR